MTLQELLAPNETASLSRQSLIGMRPLQGANDSAHSLDFLSEFFGWTCRNPSNNRQSPFDRDGAAASKSLT